MDSSDNVATIDVPWRVMPVMSSVAEHYAELPDILTVVGENAEVFATGTANLNRWKPIVDALVGVTVGSGLLAGPVLSAFETPPRYDHSYDVSFPADSDAVINSTNMPTPSKKTQRASGAEIVTHVPSKRTKVRHTPKSANKTLAAQTISTAQSYYDSHLLMVGDAEKRLTRLSCKLGKQLYPDVITPFLENLQGKGIIRMQYAGRCISKVGNRHNHVQMFRHRLATGSGFNEQTQQEHDFPVAFADFILKPFNTRDFFPDGSNPAGTTAKFVPGKTAWRDINTDKTYWAPYNLADLEDCSWNLNGLKLYPADIGGVPQAQKIADQVQSFLPYNHYRQSFLAFNNSQSVGSRPPSYRYKAVINKGSVCYDFMNKGAGGAKVECIVYRVKKNRTLLWNQGTMDFVNSAIANPIGQGYLDTVGEKVGTDDLQGRKPKDSDMWTNAEFPLLPNLKRTKQSTLAFAEVTRQTFAMPAGSRREMNFDLPGIVYDPLNQPMSTASVTNPDTPGTFDEYTYAIWISVSGVVCTDEMKLNGNSRTVYNVGDMISACDVQFYCTYTEHIGACMYKPSRAPIMYSAGTTVVNIAPGNPVTIEEVPITILDQNSAVRIPASTTTLGVTTPGIDLTSEINAAAQT